VLVVVVVLVVVLVVVVLVVVVLVGGGTDVVAGDGSMLPGTNSGAPSAVTGTVPGTGSVAPAVDALLEVVHPAINVAMAVAAAIPSR
jgi:hypothetical protein